MHSVTPAEILFEDENIVAVSKPAGRPTIPGRGDVGEALSAELVRLKGRKLFTVHRLDLEASGVVIFAKTPEAHRALNAQFETRGAQKEYWAVAAGTLTGDGVIDAPLREFGSGRVAPSPDGKKSVTRWSAARSLRGATLLTVHPETGRKHQIRAHFASIGHPLLGDPRYGPAPRPVGGAARLMLHARRLQLTAPKAYDFVCEPPPDFSAVLSRL
jgi:RluA family pseudouridine synthase